MYSTYCWNSVLFSSLGDQFTCFIMETDQSRQHTKEVHLDRLHALCRVCGERFRKRQSDTEYSQSYIALWMHVFPDLLKFHEIDIRFDTPGVHSQTLCCKYYARIKKLKFTENPSSTTFQNVQSDIEKASFLWKEFDPSLTSEQCTVCSKFSQQCKGGRPIAKKKKRTQHAPKDCDRSELEMSTFVPQAESTPQKNAIVCWDKKVFACTINKCRWQEYTR